MHSLQMLNRKRNCEELQSPMPWKNMALEEREYLNDFGFKYLANYLKLSVK